jgi:hypothetical protein
MMASWAYPSKSVARGCRKGFKVQNAEDAAVFPMLLPLYGTFDLDGCTCLPIPPADNAQDARTFLICVSTAMERAPTGTRGAVDVDGRTGTIIPGVSRV